MLAPRSQGLLDGDGFLAHQALHLGRETDGRNVKGGRVSGKNMVTFMGYDNGIYMDLWIYNDSYTDEIT